MLDRRDDDAGKLQLSLGNLQLSELVIISPSLHMSASSNVTAGEERGKTFICPDILRHDSQDEIGGKTSQPGCNIGYSESACDSPFKLLLSPKCQGGGKLFGGGAGWDEQSKGYSLTYSPCGPWPSAAPMLPADAAHTPTRTKTAHAPTRTHTATCTSSASQIIPLPAGEEGEGGGGGGGGGLSKGVTQGNIRVR